MTEKGGVFPEFPVARFSLITTAPYSANTSSFVIILALQNYRNALLLTV
jgi:hypothetical protein